MRYYWLRRYQLNKRKVMTAYKAVAGRAVAIAVGAVAVAVRIATSTDTDAAWIVTQTSTVWNFTRTVTGAEHALCKVYIIWPTPYIHVYIYIYIYIYMYINLCFCLDFRWLYWFWKTNPTYNSKQLFGLSGYYCSKFLVGSQNVVAFLSNIIGKTFLSSMLVVMVIWYGMLHISF